MVPLRVLYESNLEYNNNVYMFATLLW